MFSIQKLLRAVCSRILLAVRETSLPPVFLGTLEEREAHQTNMYQTCAVNI